MSILSGLQAPQLQQLHLLFELASPVQLNTRVSPVCVAETGDNFPGRMKCVTSGWGLIRYNGKPITEKKRGRTYASH